MCSFLFIFFHLDFSPFAFHSSQNSATSFSLSSIAHSLHFFSTEYSSSYSPSNIYVADFASLFCPLCRAMFFHLFLVMVFFLFRTIFATSCTPQLPISFSRNGILFLFPATTHSLCRLPFCILTFDFPYVGAESHSHLMYYTT